MRILAFDPAAERGVSSTGWALAEISDTKPFTLVSGGVIEGGFAGFRDGVSIDEGGYACGPWGALGLNVVVCERFVPYNRAADSSPLLIEGVIRYLWPDVVLQPSSILGKNGLVSDAVLKRLGLYSTLGHHRDKNSACAHALYYTLAYLVHKPTLELLR